MRALTFAALVLAGCASPAARPNGSPAPANGGGGVLPLSSATPTTTPTTVLVERPAAPASASRSETARAASTTGMAPAARAASLNWAALRNCESGGDYGDKRNATYRGAYQFDRQTWASVGGDGDPADASPEEQDERALLLYDARGRAPWPVCGALL